MEFDVFEKVSELELTLQEFIRQSNHNNMVLTKNLDETRRLLYQSHASLAAEMKEFKDEMKEFKDEMKEFKDEAQAESKRMNKQWGELANKMGTLIEDIVFPTTRLTLQRYFGEEIDYAAIRIEKRLKALNLNGEFDIIAISQTRAFVISVKSSPDAEKLNDIPKQLEAFKKLFPEHAHLQTIGILASLQMPPRLFSMAKQNGVYLMAYREWDYMDILNFDEIKH